MRDRLEVTRSHSDENHPLAYQSDPVACVIKGRGRALINLPVTISPANTLYQYVGIYISRNH